MNVSGKRGKRTTNNDVEKRAKIAEKPEPQLSMYANNRFFQLDEEAQRSYLDKLRQDINSFKEWNSVQLKDLLDTRGVLLAALQTKDDILASNKKELNKMKLLNGSQIELKHHLEILEKEAGLNRLSLTTRYGSICTDRKLCEQLYGFADFEFLLDFINAAFDIEYVKPANLGLSSGGGGKNTNIKKSSEVEQILLTLVFTNTRWSYDIIGLMFGVKTRSVGKVIAKWMPMLGERGDMMSHLLKFMDSDAFDALEPESYKEVGLRKVAALVDGKDFLTETVRVDRGHELCSG